MKRFAILAVLLIAACSEPLPDPPFQTATAVSAAATATVDAWVRGYYATQISPAQTPMPATATSLAAEAFLADARRRENVNAVGTLITRTQTPIAFITPDVVIDINATATRTVEKWLLGQIVVVTVTPVPLPTAVPTPTVTPVPAEVPPLIDLNSASIQEIADLPADSLGRRLGLDRAQWIEAYRSQNVIYFLDDLLGIAGIGPRTVAALRGCECTVQR